MTTAVIYSNGSQECERMSALLKFEMEFGVDAQYPQVTYGN